MSNTDLLNHPAITKMPADQQAWLDFIRALADTTDSSDASESAEFTSVLSNTHDLEDRLTALEIADNEYLVGRVQELLEAVEQLKIESLMDF